MKKRKREDRSLFPGTNGSDFCGAGGRLQPRRMLKHIPATRNFYDNPAVYELGRMAVTLFFVLSGYLITYLLLAEKKSPQNISVKDFYIRRILRIWRFYMIVILAFSYSRNSRF